MVEMAAWQPWALIIACAVVSYVPRAIGVFAGRRIDVASPLFRWFSCVAYAMLAGLVTRMILLPIGPLIDVSVWVRVGATFIAIGVFFVGRRYLPLGIVAGIVSLALLHGVVDR